MLLKWKASEPSRKLDRADYWEFSPRGLSLVCTHKGSLIARRKPLDQGASRLRTCGNRGSFGIKSGLAVPLNREGECSMALRDHTG